MGAWGANLYQDDVAQDILDRFKDQLRRGKSSEEITEELIKGYSYMIDDPDDGPIFWFALADTQWNYGRLLPEVKEQALLWLDKGGDITRWEAENPKQAIVRKKVLEELQQKLNSLQPPEKKISQYRLYTCEWKIGDVFAYQLESDLAKEKGLFGRYFLIQKVDEDVWHPGHIVPIAYIKITDDETLPTSVEEYDRLEYVQTSSSKFDLWVQEFRPPEKNLTKDDFLRKGEEIKAGLQFDDFGFLPQFRIKLINTSKRVIPKKLIYIDNFAGATPPTIEYVRKDKISVPALSWERFNKTIEIHLIEKYFNFNKRQSKIY